jgi:nitrate reductase gamma subunit
MNALIALAAVALIALLAAVGGQVSGLRPVFALVLPYAAILLFLGGFIAKIVRWARAPVPFRIPTTCGQQKSLDWIPSSYLDNPHSTSGVIGRMALEVLTFRSLFRNTRVEVREGGQMVHAPSKWLWLFALVFHYAFLVVFIRHLRFFTEPVPVFVNWVQTLDGFFQVGVPIFYLTSFALIVGAGYLFLRRIGSAQLRYITLPTDYFPLFLILAIAVTGILLRHVVKTDLVGVKALALGLLSFQPVVPAGVHWLFYVHFFMVCVLFAVFPYSKLMHMAGVFLSPTRNLANTNRRQHHTNPWNPPGIKPRPYEEYEDEFRDKMVAAGIPVEKE